MGYNTHNTTIRRKIFQSRITSLNIKPIKKHTHAHYSFDTLNDAFNAMSYLFVQQSTLDMDLEISLHNVHAHYSRDALDCTFNSPLVISIRTIQSILEADLEMMMEVPPRALWWTQVRCYITFMLPVFIAAHV